MTKTALHTAIRNRLNNKEAHVSHVDYPHAYASEALKCRRQIAYRVAGVPEEEEFATTSLIAWTVGNHIHNIVQDAFRDLYPDFQDEVRWELPGITGRADGLYTHPEKGRVIVEIKTMNPRYYAAAVRGNVPQAEHMLQADISAYALKADYVQLVYIQKVKEGDLDPIHDWIYKADLKTAQKEIESLQKTVALAAEGYLPECEYEGEVIDPVDKGKKWPCGYCAFRSRCLKDGPGIIPIPTIRDLGPELLKGLEE